MGSAKSTKVLVLMIISGLMASSIGFVRTASAISESFSMAYDVSGGGSAGPGSLAVAAVFSLRDSSGAGAFSGNLAVPSGPQSGLFSLRFTMFLSDLSCPAGQVSAGGSVTSGSFLGEQVLVEGCVGSGVLGAFIIYHGTPSNPDFSGKGTGTATLSRLLEHEGIFVAAGATSGSGSTGSGTTYTAEADALLSDGSFLGSGAAIGSTDRIPVYTPEWTITTASVGPSCTLKTSGVTTSFSSFPNQPVSSAYTLVSCPPSSLGPQTARFVYAIGGDASPIYKGTGSALVELFAFLAE